MGKPRTLRFHTTYGPAPLFDKARDQLKDLAELNLEIPHAQSRFTERGIPLQHLTDFRPEYWELITVETAVRTGRIVCISLRLELDSYKDLWIVLVFEHVITAWISHRRRIRTTDPLIVKDGPAWDAAAAGQDPKITPAMAEWEQAYARLVRAQRILTTLAALPERPNGARLSHAARFVLAGGSWKDAAAAGGWASRKSLDTAIERVFRAAKRSRTTGDDG